MQDTNNDVDNGGNCRGAGGREYMRILYFLCNFSVNPKLL